MPRRKDDQLKLLSMRLRREDIDTARRTGRNQGLPYQHVIRRWVAIMAEKERGGEA